MKRPLSWGIFLVVFFTNLKATIFIHYQKAQTVTRIYRFLGRCIVTLAISMTLLVKATQTLPIGTAYAVWTGIGAFGTVLAGIVFFKEPTTFFRLFFLATLIISIIGLRVVSP